MKNFKSYFVAALVALITFSSCEKKEEPVAGKTYPAGAIVWKKDTVVTLTNHYIVPKGTSLYIEEGVQIIMADTIVRPEFIVLGNLYCYGTEAKPIRFSVEEKYRTEAKRFARYWGGIICGYESKEVLLQNTIIEFGGAQTTDKSESFKNALFKTETGEGVPGFHFCNLAGSVVITNCTFRNNAEDQIYITGGKSIISNNKFIVNGFDGGDAINYKSGCLADISYNLIYDANSNALKLSNNGALEPQAHLIAYNNTLVNCGWRRPKVKGGSIWLELNVFAELYNNLTADARWACKRDAANKEDARSIITPNYYYASTAIGATQYLANATTGQLVGANDIISASAGDKNPNFVNYTPQATMDINAGSTKSGNVPQTFSTTWDFRLKAGSSALTGGITTFTRNFATTAITIDGKTYNSPAPAAYFGAFGL